MRDRSQPDRRGTPEKPNPGIDGMTRSNAGSRSVSGAIRSSHSTTDIGQPWISNSGRAPLMGERTCRWCRSTPSMLVRYCG